MYRFVIAIIVLVFFSLPGVDHEGVISWTIEKGTEWRVERVERRLEWILDHLQEQYK